MTSSTGHGVARRLPAACVVVVVAPLASACGAPETVTGTSAQTDAVADPVAAQDGAARGGGVWGDGSWNGEHCPRLAAPVSLTPADRPTAALSCGSDIRVRPGDGEWAYAFTSRATEGLESLLAALRLPSEPVEPDVVCSAMLVLPRVVVLEIEGAPRAVSAPTSVCRQTREEVQAAYRALTWVETSAAPLSRVRGEAAVAAGCGRWKDEISLVGELAPKAAEPAVPRLPVEALVSVCVYRSDYPPGWKPPVNGAGEVVDGVPSGGVTLTAAASASLIASLSDLPPAAACAVRHERFAILRIGPEWVSVELDGCRRVLLPGSGSLRQGSPALTALLAAG